MQSQSRLQIPVILILLAVAIYFFGFLKGFGSNNALPSWNSSAGQISIFEFNGRIDKAIAAANETGVLATDRRRLWLSFILPPVLALISIACGLRFIKRKQRADQQQRQRTTFRICCVCFVCALAFEVAQQTEQTFLSTPLLKVCGNPNTNPPVVQPGDTVRVRIDYSAGIESIQQRHFFDSVAVSNLVYRSAAGKSGVVISSGSPEAGSGEQPNWSNFNRLLPQVPLKDIDVKLHLPEQPELQGSLVTGNVAATVAYPVWADRGRPESRTSSIDGHLSFWVADTQQAEFVATAQAFLNWENDANALTIMTGLATILTALVAAVLYQAGKTRPQRLL
jgi:hypothetical protein